MDNFQTRLQTEQVTLQGKVDKLSMFLESLESEKLSPLQQDLLHAQLHAMASYLSILHTRMRHLDIPLLDPGLDN